METIGKRYDAIHKTLTTLKESLELVKDPKYKLVYESMRDSAIQRFEYSIDTLWKFLKIYLQEEHKVSFDVVTPRAVFRKSLNANLIQRDEFNVLVDGVSDRNMTSHTYNEELAEEILSHIPRYYETMKTIIDRIEL